MKKAIYSFALSALLLILLSWVKLYSLYSAAWCESVCYFALTYFLLDNWRDKGKYDNMAIFVAIVAGRIVLELPLRIMEFREMLPTLFYTFIAVMGIGGGALYHRHKSWSVLLLLLILWVLLNTACHEAYYDYFNAIRHTSHAMK